MRPKRELPLIILLVALATAAAVLAIAHRSSESGTKQRSRAVGAVLGRSHTSRGPRVAMGGHFFVQFACAACHGPQGGGGASPDAPALEMSGGTVTVGQLSSRIRHEGGACARAQEACSPVCG